MKCCLSSTFNLPHWFDKVNCSSNPFLPNCRIVVPSHSMQPVQTTIDIVSYCTISSSDTECKYPTVMFLCKQMSKDIRLNKIYIKKEPVLKSMIATATLHVFGMKYLCHILVASSWHPYVYLVHFIIRSMVLKIEKKMEMENLYNQMEKPELLFRQCNYIRMS